MTGQPGLFDHIQEQARVRGCTFASQCCGGWQGKQARCQSKSWKMLFVLSRGHINAERCTCTQLIALLNFSVGLHRGWTTCRRWPSDRDACRIWIDASHLSQRRRKREMGWLYPKCGTRPTLGTYAHVVAPAKKQCNLS